LTKYGILEYYLLGELSTLNSPIVFAYIIDLVTITGHGRATVDRSAIEKSCILILSLNLNKETNSVIVSRAYHNFNKFTNV